MAGEPENVCIDQKASRKGAKTQRDAKWKSFLCFATFACFAPLREPVFLGIEDDRFSKVQFAHLGFGL